MSRLPILSFLFLFTGAIEAQEFPYSEFRAIVSGDANGVIERLSNALTQSAVRNDTLLHARTLEMLGEQYYRLSDIDAAREAWEKAFRLRQAKFGMNSAEIGVAYAWQVRYHNYISASQRDHLQIADELSLQALLSMRSNGDVLPYERIMAQRERAYAYKIANPFPEQEARHGAVIARPQFRKALATAIANNDTIWIAQLLHDLGNTFTDRAMPLRDNAAELAVARDSALWYYSRSIQLMASAGMGVSEPVMMDHLCIGLLHMYAEDALGSHKAIASFERALRVLREMAGISGGQDPYGYHPTVANKAQVIELFAFIAECYEELFYLHDDAAYLDSAVHVIEATFPYWDSMVQHYDSKEIHRVTGTYAHFSFQHAARLYIARYLERKREEDLLKAIMAVERNRNVKEQRERLGADQAPLEFFEKYDHLDEIVAPERTLIIVYCISFSNYAFAIDENGVGLIDLGAMPFDPYDGIGKFKPFPVNERSRDMHSYGREGSGWYNVLIGPIMEGRDVQHLVIVPQGSIEHLPFETLVVDTGNGDPGEFLYLMDKYAVRYAPDLHSALVAPRSTSLEGAVFALSQSEDQSELPFANSLVQTMAEEVVEARIAQELASSELRDLLQDDGILHIASHARSDQDPGSEPFLILKDGIWRAAGMDELEVERDLIVLATCSGASGRIYCGEGSQSMGNAVLRAGAGSVVHALWPVDDKATNEILRYMYEELLNGEPASQALHSAKTRFREHHKNDGLGDPFYWGGLILTGEDVILREEPLPSVWLAAGGMLLLLIGRIFYKRSSNSTAR